jgi:hypothetical protein
MTEHEAPDGYEGDVTVTADGAPPQTARAALAARFDLLAGHVVWSGRVAAPFARARRSSRHAPRHGPRRGHRDRRVGQHAADRRRAAPFPVELLDGA